MRIPRNADIDRAVLHYVLDGRCRLTAAGTAPLDLAGGDLALLPAGARHRLAARPGAPGAPRSDPGVVYENGPGAAPVVRRYELGGPGPPVRLLSARLAPDRGTAVLAAALPRALALSRGRIEEDPLLRATLRLLAAPGRRPGPGDRLLALRAFETALALAAAPPSRRPCHSGLARALAAVEDRYAEPWTVTGLAREAGMSRSAFTAAFHEAVGTSPARHLAARRMREAARLLAETSLPQSAVPARVGYHSRAGFHLAFRTAHGTTPGEYRAAAPRRGTPDAQRGGADTFRHGPGKVGE
ncbi:AraC family transcriptional regulator [Streptomyces termitum]|uniref:AraC family transcriptional regulator n=1 Tax=Streptomyces termitum TaxID=67368 RepID=UPI00339DD8E5